MGLKAIFIFFILTGISHISSAQIYINGIVTDSEDKTPLAGCSIILRDSVNNILSYSITGADGKYRLQLKGTKTEERIIEASLLGYSILKIALNSARPVYNFELMPSPIDLAEVKVTAPKISYQADTVNYTVANFKEPQDRVIGDVLRKIPGIEVKQDGTIFYNGKAISRFYIEGLDLLEGKYNLASNNIPADAVSFVQIFENHQDIKALQNAVFSDKAALNLKFTDIAKSKIIWRLEPGVGLKPLLWDANVFMMQLSKKFQNLNAGHTNNTGKNISDQLKVLTIESLKESLENKSDEADIISAPLLSTPAINSERFLFNNSGSLSTNNVFQLKNEYQLKLNLDYIKDRVEQTNDNFIEYTDANDSSIIIRENYRLVKLQNLLSTGLTVTANKKAYYLKNSLNVGKRWSDTKFESSGDEHLKVTLSLPMEHIKNDFTFIKHVSRNIFQFRSFFSYSDLPQNLFITPGLYSNTVNDGVAYEALQQQGSLNSIVSNTSFSIRKKTGKWNREYLGGIFIQSQAVDSRMEKRKTSTYYEIGDSADNYLNGTRIQYLFKPNMEFLGDKLNLNIDIPLRYYLFRIKEKHDSDKAVFSRFFITPQVSLHYKLHNFWKLQLRYNYSANLSDCRDFTSGYRLIDYRTLIKNETILKEQKTNNLSFGLYYKNPVKAIFSGIILGYTTSGANTMYQTKIVETLTYRILTKTNNITNSWHVNGRISKTFDVIPLSLWLEGNFSTTMMQHVFQNILSDYKYKTLQLKSKVHIRFASWTNMDYETAFSHSQMGITSPASIDFDPLDAITQTIAWYLIPVKSIHVWLKGEYFYGKSRLISYPKDIFADIGIRYTSRQISYSLEWRNLLNIKDYIYANLSDLAFSASHYKLRPSDVLVKISFSF
jgi:hypothetical protein